jgi:hypothetical protein
MHGVLTARNNCPYTVNGQFLPNNPPVKLQPSAALSIPGARLVDCKCYDAVWVWMMEFD